MAKVGHAAFLARVGMKPTAENAVRPPPLAFQLDLRTRFSWTTERAASGDTPPRRTTQGDDLAGGDEYNQLFLATRMQAVFRGARARRLAKARVTSLEEEYAATMQVW
jgi:hypothetical protein